MHEHSAPEFFLTDETFISICKGVIVFLNLELDSYHSIPPDYTYELLLLLGLGCDLNPRPLALDEQARKEFMTLVDGLVKMGLLTNDCSNGKYAKLFKHSEPLQEIGTFGFSDLSGSPLLKSAAYFILALIITAYLFKFKDLSEIVNRIKKKSINNRMNNDICSDKNITSIMASFRWLRPFGPSLKNACLFNSHILIEFCSFFNIYPSWIFGIRVMPFKAHCWVENNGLIYDDSIEIISSYSVIARF